MDCRPLEHTSHPIILCVFPVVQCMYEVEAILELELIDWGGGP